MKIIHVTDIHLGPRDLVRFSVNQHARLAQAIDHINVRHGDAALCVLTGDLADTGDVPTYEALKSALGKLRTPYRLMLGNHDRRNAFRTVFPDDSSAEAFVQSALDRDGVRLLFLDTLAEGEIDGAFDDERLKWLEAGLFGAADRIALVFMHHPPLALGMPFLDRVALRDPGPFLACLKQSGARPHIFFGHVHRSVHGTVSGIPFTAQRGLSVQFDLIEDEALPVGIGAPPSYGVILVDADRLVVHEETFATGWDRYDLATGRPIEASVDTG